MVILCKRHTGKPYPVAFLKTKFKIFIVSLQVDFKCEGGLVT